MGNIHTVGPDEALIVSGKLHWINFDPLSATIYFHAMALIPFHALCFGSCLDLISTHICMPLITIHCVTGYMITIRWYASCSRLLCAD